MRIKGGYVLFSLFIVESEWKESRLHSAHHHRFILENGIDGYWAGVCVCVFDKVFPFNYWPIAIFEQTRILLRNRKKIGKSHCAWWFDFDEQLAFAVVVRLRWQKTVECHSLIALFPQKILNKQTNCHWTLAPFCYHNHECRISNLNIGYPVIHIAHTR